jgi:hypothetical protein
MFAGYKIVRQDYNLHSPVFYYTLNHSIGIGITAKKWLKNTPAFMESRGIDNVNYDRLGILTNDEYKSEKEKRIKDLGLREWIYAKFTHPLKRKLRHKWFIQDVLNMKKYIKYWNYYRKMK